MSKTGRRKLFQRGRIGTTGWGATLSALLVWAIVLLEFIPQLSSTIYSFYPFGFDGWLVTGLIGIPIIWGWFRFSGRNPKAGTRIADAISQGIPQIIGNTFYALVAMVTSIIAVAIGSGIDIFGELGTLLSTVPTFFWGMFTTILTYINLGGNIPFVPGWMYGWASGLEPIQWLGVVLVVGGVAMSLKYS